ncbi:MAG: hypothetical protein ACLUHE_13180 [Christensenellales bacterium]
MENFVMLGNTPLSVTRASRRHTFVVHRHPDVILEYGVRISSSIMPSTRRTSRMGDSGTV